jgi:DNA-binding transcriptional MerR regulator
MSYSVGELARLAGVSVRTLHHYDEIGLLTPSERTASGYRQYGAADAARLHRILVYRELGFGLRRIAEILQDPAADAGTHLRRQHALLTEQMGRLSRMLKGVEAMMSAGEKSYNLSAEEMKEVFGSFDPAEHEAEAERRWGDTDAYRQSRERAARYGKQQWLEIRREAERIEAELAASLQQGLAADSEAAMALAEAHRRHIDRWFYECSYSMHRGLAELYVADPRFAAHYEERATGLSGFFRAAIIANAERASR